MFIQKQGHSRSRSSKTEVIHGQGHPKSRLTSSKVKSCKVKVIRSHPRSRPSKVKVIQGHDCPSSRSKRIVKETGRKIVREEESEEQSQVGRWGGR